MPTGDEIMAALVEYSAAVEAQKTAYESMMTRRERVVDVLHRAGVVGFSL
jgi:hypothetical protein